MGISGEEYDRFAGPDFTPNKDRRMAEWRKKKEAERQEDLEKRGKEEAARAAEAEDKPEVTNVVSTPMTNTDTELLNAIENGIPGAVYKKPRRSKRKPGLLNPTLFDDLD